MKITPHLALLAAASLGVATTCAPLPHSSSPRVAPTPSTPPAINWLSKDPSGALVLPARVHVRVPAENGGDPAKVIELPLEEYVEGVVAAELAIWSAEPAELEAQAIAARTYAASALAKRSRSAGASTLEAGVMDQAYHGPYNGSDSPGAGRVAARLQAAVARTRGMVLVRGSRLEETRYHASCGGHTASFADVFEGEVRLYDASGPTGFPCEACLQRAHAEQAAGGPDEKRPISWLITLGGEDLTRLGQELGLNGPVRLLEPSLKDRGGRWIRVFASTDPGYFAVPPGDRSFTEHISAPGQQEAGPVVEVPFDRVRSIIGYNVLKSAQIDAAVWSSPFGEGDVPTLHLQGRGRGHGVGLCQEGARDMARAGRSAEEILTHYYAGAHIERLREVSVP